LTTVDVGTLLDEGKWSGYQKLLVFATAFAILLDGVNGQLLAMAIPALATEWGIPATRFGSVIVMGLVGMMIGAVGGGMMGDKYGRRGALLGSTLLFGVLTLVTGLVSDFFSLAMLRFLASLGLGGAIPNATALASEYVPRRGRACSVTLTFVCVPLGGTLAAVLGGQLISGYGWRGMFGVGGILPILLVAVLWKTLPESPRYLARRRTRWYELVRLMKRLGHELPPGELAFVDAAETGPAHATLGDLFSPAFRRDSLALGAAFLFCLLSASMGFNWLPIMLGDSGVGPALISDGVFAFNACGVVSAILAVWVIQRLGSKAAMLGMCLAAVVGAAALSVAPVGPALTASMLLGMLALTGGMIHATQTTMYALAAHVYPTPMRATGVGAVVSIGGIGGALSVSLGPWAIAAGGGGAVFAALAAAMSLVFLSLLAVGRHLPRVARHPGGAYAVQPTGR
jgi:AAHS family 4-hydroxybenzoate transporter-like MFS transporter